MFKHGSLVLIAVMIFWAGTTARSQDATPVKPDSAPKQDAAAKQDKGSEETKQEPPTTSVAPANVEISPKTLDAHVGEKVKFSAVAKDAAGNTIDEKPSVWFAAPFDVAGADESGEVSFHAPGVVTVGAVIAGKTGYATVNVGDSKVTGVEIETPAHPTVVVGSAENQRESADRCGHQVDFGEAIDRERGRGRTGNRHRARKRHDQGHG